METTPDPGLAPLTALDCIDRLRAILTGTFPDDLAWLHPMSAMGARSAQSLNECRQIVAHMKRIVASKSAEARPDRSNGLRSEHSKLQRQLRDLKEALAGSAKRFRAVVDKEALIDQRYLPMTLSSIQKVCEAVGGLSCDIDQTSTAIGRPDARSFTVVIGSEGEHACFALEASIVADQTSSTITVDSVSTTFQFGDVEWSSDQVDEDIRSVIEKYDAAKFHEKLRALTELENLINSRPDFEGLVSIRDRIRPAFGDDAVDFFEGPGAVLARIPVNLLSSEPAFNYTLRFFSAFIDDDHVKYHFKIEPDLPIMFSSAATLYGQTPKTDASEKCPSLLSLVLGPSTRDMYYSYFESCQMSARSPKGLLSGRAILISDLVFNDDDDFAQLRLSIPIIRRQALFNCLFRSCFFHDPKLEYQRVQTSPILLEVIEADPGQGRLRISANKPGYRDLDCTITIDLAGMISIEHRDRPDDDSAAKSAAILSKSLSVPVMTFFFYLRQR